MKFIASLVFVPLVVLSVSFFINPSKVFAVTPPDRGLGAADSYSVFGKAGVTTTGVTHVWGNAGADSSVGLISSQVGGSIITDGDTAGVATDASSTYDSLMSASQGTPTGLSLAGTHTTGNGNPITPGVYTVGAITMDGAVELSGAGVYIFRSDSSENIATVGASMTLTNGACASDVFWAIPASMTIGSYSHIEGTIIAQTGLISLGTGATLVGRAISLISQVTLDANQITQPTCAAVTPTPSENTFNEDTRCLATTPLVPQWSSRYAVEGGVNLLWSAVGGNKVDIEIANDKGEFVYKYTQVPNTGHMFLPNVTLSQDIRIRVFNECEYGEWLIASNNAPSLPNTGFAPHKNIIPWYVPASLSLLQKLTPLMY